MASNKDIGLGPEFDKIMDDLRNLKGYEKNKYLNNIKSERLIAQNLLEKQIIDAEYQIKRIQLELRVLKNKKELFDAYDDGRDPY